jgi:adenylyltransferase/sulfurtransferase
VTLGDDQLDRYARHIVLREIGGEGQRRLLDSAVTLVGAGGIGAPALQYLAAAGVGRLRVIDDDRVSLDNLQRQILFGTADVGRPKVEVASEAVKRLNPDVRFCGTPERLTAANASALLAGAEVVIDGSDNFATRLCVSDACVKLGMPLLSAAAMQFQGQVALFRAQPCYRCFVGDAFDADDCDTCAEQGVLGALTATVGSFAALMAIRAIVGIGEDSAGKLNLFNGVSLAWRTMRIPADPGCKACGQASA